MAELRVCSKKSTLRYKSYEQSLVLLICLLIYGLGAEGATSDGLESKTAYACEEDQLILECQQGEVIRILRANYGRFTISVCNRQGQTEGWNLQCMLPKAKDIISERCDGRRECDMSVSNHVFGDPCPLTSKYAEVKYTCHLANHDTSGADTTMTTQLQIQPQMPLNGSPRPPLITSVTALNPHQIEIVWTQTEPPAPILTTAVYFKDIATAIGPSALFINSGNALIINSLKPNTTYSIFLKSFNTYGPSVTSDTVIVTTPPLVFPDEISTSAFSTVITHTTTSKPSPTTRTTKKMSSKTSAPTDIMDASDAALKSDLISTMRRLFTSMFSSKNATNLNIKPTTATEMSLITTAIVKGSKLSAFIRVASSSGAENRGYRNSSKENVHDYKAVMEERLQDNLYETTSPADVDNHSTFHDEMDISGANLESNMELSYLKQHNTSQNRNVQHESNLHKHILLAVSPTLETDATDIKMELQKTSQLGDHMNNGSYQNYQFKKYKQLKTIKDSSEKQNGDVAFPDLSFSEKVKSYVNSAENSEELHSTLVTFLQRVVENDDLWWTKFTASNFDSIRNKNRLLSNEHSANTIPTNLTAEKASVVTEIAGQLSKSEITDNKIDNENSDAHFHRKENQSLISNSAHLLSFIIPLTTSAVEAEILSQSPWYQTASSTTMKDRYALAPQSTGAYESTLRLTTSGMGSVKLSHNEIFNNKISSSTRQPDVSSSHMESTLKSIPINEPAANNLEGLSPNVDTSSNDQLPYEPQDPGEAEDSESINGVVDKFCEEKVYRGVLWPKTRFGRLAEQNCPENLRGMTTWRCQSFGWDKSGPDLSDCISAWMERIDMHIQKMMIDKEPSELTAVALNEALRDQDLTSGDLKRASMKLLPKLAQVFQEDDGPSVSRPNKIQRMKKFQKAFVSTSSNLLSKKNAKSWQNLSRQDQRRAATSLVLAIEDTGFHIASLIDIGSSEVTVDTNLILEVKVIDTLQAINDLTFPSSKELTNTSWQKVTDSITISSNSLRSLGTGGSIKVVFTLYKNIEDLIHPQPNTFPSVPPSYLPSASYNSPEIVRDDIPVERSEPSAMRVINTKIVAVSINSAKQNQLSEPVRFTLHHLQPTSEGQPVCAFWDMDTSYLGGQWSQSGCRMLNTNTTHTTCECDHLTNFAVLMDVTNIKLSHENQLALRVVTYVGCVISVICLILSWITFLVFKNLQCDRITIHKNLVFCLLLAEIVFLTGIAQTEPKILCSIIACILHYLFLSAFAWMCLEGIQLYIMLVEVFEQEKSRVHLYYLFGYGAPAVIVAVSAGVYHQGYGTAKHCWLTTERYFIWSFVGPVLAVMMINIIMLSIAIYIMCQHTNMSATMRERSKSTKFSTTESLSSMETFAPAKLRFPDLPAWLKGAIVLVVLLGLTWLLGVLYLNEESVVIAYFFTVLNSLQGLFIFVFHCLKNEKVQKEYRKVARRTQWLPNCIRVNYGGYTGVASSSPIGSSGSGNYLSKLFGQRNRNSAASTNSSAKPFLSNSKHRSDAENSTSKDSSNVPSSLNGYVYNPSYSTIKNGSHAQTPFHSINGIVDDGRCGQAQAANNYERVDEITMDLSECVDCSVVDSEYVSEYCRHNMQISREEHRYSTGSEDSDGRKPEIPHRTEEVDNLSTLSLASSSRKPSSCVSSNQSLNEDFNKNYEEKLKKKMLEPNLNLHQYIIPAYRKSSSHNNNIDVNSITNKTMVENINISSDKLSTSSVSFQHF